MSLAIDFPFLFVAALANETVVVGGISKTKKYEYRRMYF